MKASELRALTDEQLETKLQELYAEWRDLRFQEAVGQLTATARPRQIRTATAGIYTILGEPERAEQAQA